MQVADQQPCQQIDGQCGGQIIQGCAVQLGMEGLRPEFERDDYDYGIKPEIGQGKAVEK